MHRIFKGDPPDFAGAQLLEYHYRGDPVVPEEMDERIEPCVVCVFLVPILEQLERHVSFLKLGAEGHRQSPYGIYPERQTRYSRALEAFEWLKGQRNTDFPHIVWDDALPHEALERLVGRAACERFFSSIQCPACGCEYMPTEIMVESWSQVYKELGGAMGEKVFCPRHHLLVRDRWYVMT